MSQYTEFTALKPEMNYENVKGIKYKLLKDLVWKIGHITGPTYEVPEGFVFDLSIPFFLRWLFDPHDMKYLKAAALHDHMLHVGQWSRITAAGEFHNALKASGVVTWKRILMFLATVFWKYS